MPYGICQLSIVPIRRKPSDTSEMVSQLLFGETYTVVETRRRWVHIRCSFDDCEGWIDHQQAYFITEKVHQNMQKNCAYSLEIVGGAMTSDHYIPIVMGSTLPNCDGMNLKINQKRYTFSGQIIQPKAVKITPSLLIKIARKYLYAPYQWGGTSPFGIDCSGFTQAVFKMVGTRLKRDVGEQVHQGDLISFFEEAQPGDLAFFDNRKGKIIHTGLILPENQIIHVSGRVRIDTINAKGIYDIESQKYSHKLRVIKRLLSLDLYDD